jgi:hypothetical protein
MENRKTAAASWGDFPDFTPVCWRGYVLAACAHERAGASNTPLTQNREICETKIKNAEMLWENDSLPTLRFHTPL